MAKIGKLSQLHGNTASPSRPPQASPLAWQSSDSNQYSIKNIPPTSSPVRRSSPPYFVIFWPTLGGRSFYWFVPQNLRSDQLPGWKMLWKQRRLSTISGNRFYPGPIKNLSSCSFLANQPPAIRIFKFNATGRDFQIFCEQRVCLPWFIIGMDVNGFLAKAVHGCGFGSPRGREKVAHLSKPSGRVSLP